MASATTDAGEDKMTENKAEITPLHAGGDKAFIPTRVNIFAQQREATTRGFNRDHGSTSVRNAMKADTSTRANVPDTRGNTPDTAGVKQDTTTRESPVAKEATTTRFRFLNRTPTNRVVNPASNPSSTNENPQATTDDRGGSL